MLRRALHRAMASSRNIAVIGGGPAGLIAAERLSAQGHRVDLFERMPTLGRKFLMAGRGGLNLTHAEPLEAFLGRYSPVAEPLAAAIRVFDPGALQAWAQGLGQPTFIGSSGRVFPEAMKASPLLRAWIARLTAQGVRFHLRHEMRGVAAGGALRIAAPQGERLVTADAAVLALGGASWPRLGANGDWTSWLDAPLAPFEAANAGVAIAWSAVMKRHAGTPLKRIALSLGAAKAAGEAAGEVVITKQGLEGGAVYALSRPLRAALAKDGAVRLIIDLKPGFRAEWIAYRLSSARAKDSLASRLRKAAGLQPNGVSLVFEAALAEGIDRKDYDSIAGLVRALPLRVTGLGGLERAISSAGGVRWAGMDGNFMLKNRPGVFLAGEMLDWEAPTGGYLLQACFATGLAAAEGALRWLAAQ